jgi:deazaflavin-dependent oxidoreductase (nitroreductase family)
MRLTHGRLTSIGTWPRCVLLSHTGAKSGIERATPLIYFTDDDRVILVASNYGGARHPAWYYNVKANPNVTLCAGGFEGDSSVRKFPVLNMTACGRCQAMEPRLQPVRSICRRPKDTAAGVHACRSDPPYATLI